MKRKNITSSRLVSYLKLLKADEHESISDFLKSPFFNRRQDVVALFDFLWPAHPLFDQLISRQDISAYVYKTDGALSLREDNKVRNLMSRLVSLIETYFIQTKQQEHDLRQKRYLLDALIARKGFKLAYQKSNAIRAKHVATSQQNAIYYFNNYLLDEADFYLNVLTKQRSKTTTVKPVLESLRSYALTNLFLYYCAGVNLQRIMKYKSDFPLLPFLTDYLAQNLSDQPPILQIYYHILFMLMEREGPFHFKAALDLVTENGRKFNFSDQRHIYSFLLNFCSGKIRIGESSYRQYRYKIYKECLAQELWITNSYLPAHHYVLHINNMMHLQKYQETAAFIQAATPTLPPKYSKNIPALCKAMSCLYQGQLEECHDYLLEIDKLDDYLFVLFQKILNIQLFLEKEEHSLARSSIQSLQAYLRPARKKNISTPVQEGFINFASLAARLLNYNENKDYDSRSPDILAKLRRDILASPNLYEREWLML